tara:strand:- start:4554 stop:5057 length:504 start_codon:yes stop_codon:yes gene_type:complete
MANRDILCFLEYYADRTNVLDGSGDRAPTNQWQNFYQTPQTLSVDSDVSGEYFYLAFDIEGFGSSIGGEINDLTVSIAATGELVDITDSAMGADNLVVASLYVQDGGSDSLDASSAQLISRFYGSISAAAVSDATITWTVNPGISNLKAQVPFRALDTDLIGRFDVP